MARNARELQCHRRCVMSRQVQIMDCHSLLQVDQQKSAIKMLAGLLVVYYTRFSDMGDTLTYGLENCTAKYCRKILEI